MSDITKPPFLDMCYSLAQTAVEFAKSGWKLVTREHFKARLQICKPCKERKNKTCLACGCWLPGKAWMDIAVCTSKREKRNKWKDVDALYTRDETQGIDVGLDSKDEK